ncbi:hypothetical protein RJC98_06480 [Pseudomonas allii]|jgi:hypothetical protein|uniref:Uncharacterized protein n=1 Tax=Pseudomonas allii TaxID=2740531 RepID=A0ACC6L8M9_9PSED|nr:MULTISPECIES: hypothetical protein [Pseudomonas]KTB66025.1 hypothetical protein AO066_24615 [Pseudomonas fluorescens]MDR9874816.1 hypothetical protein [Pseudomonas allii]RMP85337.1 hypothetical protein ALQ17_03677 [Pseudomonas fluorescens]BDB16709.1 hypothetical protein cym2001_00740 [Pseudomonas sp. CYM-20-01]
MRVDTTSDSPSWTKVFEITDELNGLSEILEKKYPSLDWELAVCMRCLPQGLERKTFCRYYTKDKMFGLDIAMDEEDFIPYKKDKAAQRKLIGAAFFEFFVESIKKYEKKLPNLQPVSEQLIADVKQWCTENEWVA